MHRFFRQFTKRRDDSVEAKLKHWAGWHERMFRIFTFVSVGGYKLRLAEFFWTGDYSELFQSMKNPARWNAEVAAKFVDYAREMGAIAALFAATVFWYQRYRKAVLKEIGILGRLFPDKKPADWDRVSGASLIPVLGIILPITFVLLCALVDYPRLFCIVALGLSFMDLSGNIGVQRNLIRYVNDPEYAVDPARPDAGEIGELRQAAICYWLDHPQLARIFVMIVLELGAFFVASTPEVEGVRLWPQLCDLLLILAIIGNEAVMTAWRWSRDHAIFDAEEKRLASTAETPGPGQPQPP